MTVGLGAWLAATVGALAGVVEVRLRPEPQQGAALLGAVAGGIIGVLAYGIRCIVTQRELGTIIWPSEVEGGAAIALGVGWIGVGLYLHFHFFFGLHRGLARHSRRGKSIGLVLACAGLTVAGDWSVIGRVP